MEGKGDKRVYCSQKFVTVRQIYVRTYVQSQTPSRHTIGYTCGIRLVPWSATKHANRVCACVCPCVLMRVLCIGVRACVYICVCMCK